MAEFPGPINNMDLPAYLPINLDMEDIKKLPQSENIIITGSGPSILKCTKFMSNIPNKIVISPNRNFITTDYTLFIDNNIYSNNKGKIKNKIIVGPKIKKPPKDAVYLNYDYKNPTPKIINIKDDLYIPHSVGGSGFAAIIVSTFMQPKNIYISGFDGPQKNILNHANSSSGVINKNKIPKLKTFLNTILQYLLSENINIHISRHDPFWGINTKRIAHRF